MRKTVFPLKMMKNSANEFLKQVQDDKVFLELFEEDFEFSAVIDFCEIVYEFWEFGE